MKHIKKYESFSVNEELQLFNFAAALKQLVSMSADEIKKKFPGIDKAVENDEVKAVLSNQKPLQLKKALADPNAISESKINENFLTNKLKSIWDKVKAPAALVSAAAALAPIFMGMKDFVTSVPSDTFKFLGFNDYDPGGQSVTGLGFAAMVYAVAALAFYVKKGLVDKQVAAETTRKPISTTKTVKPTYQTKDPYFSKQSK